MSYVLNAILRTEKGEKTREEGKLPAVVYGAGGEAVSLDLEVKEFEKLQQTASESSLIDLNIDGKLAGKVLIQEVQYEPVKGKTRHVDLRRIDMNKPITAMVELRFVGESPVIKSAGGTFVHNIDEVEVTCLPNVLMEHIDVDISILKTFDDLIKVKDLNIPAGAEITSPSLDNVVAKAAPAMTEDEIKAAEEAGKAPVDLSKIEVAAKKKETDEEAEGEDGAEKKVEKKAEKK